MSKKYLILFTFIFVVPGVAQKMPEATLTPAPLTDAQRALVREASMLQMGGKFDEAIKKLTEAEKENAANDVIAFELAKSYFGKKSYSKCIENGMEAAKYFSPRLARVYSVIGNCYDAKDDSQKALEIYSFALQQFPNDGTLHLNQAATLSTMGKLDESRKAAKRSAQLEPNNSSTHLLLASVFLQQGYRIPALFSAARFITLEPSSQRTPFGLEILKRAFESKIKNPSKSAAISIGDDANTDEGDFTSMETALAENMIEAAKTASKKKSDVERSIEQFELILNLLPLEQEQTGEPPFIDIYYVPYFKEMQQRKLVETLWQMIYAAGKRSEAEDWLNKNQQKVNEFMNWSSGYQWPPSN